MHIIRLIKKGANVSCNQGIVSLINICLNKYFTLKYLPSIVVNRPVWAQIEITNACNLECRMCAHSAKTWQSEIPPKTLKLQEFKKIIDQLPFIQFALLNGVGEPLLNPHLIDMIQYANSKGIKTGFFTNVTKMTPEVSEELIITEGLININASVDAGNPETFEKIRIGAKFSEICNNLRSFIEIKRKSGKDIPHLSVWMVAIPQVVEEIPALIKTLGEIGVTHLNIKNILEGEETEGTQISSEHIKLIEMYKEKATRHNVVLSYSKLPKGNRNRPKTRTCDDPWRIVYLNADGRINPCCYSFGDKSTYFGNIFQDGLKKIWNNKSYKNFRNELKDGMPNVCIKCPKHSPQWIGVKQSI